MNVWEEIKRIFSHANALSRLIYINIAVFLAVNIVYVFIFLLNVKDPAWAPVNWLAVPADPGTLVRKPWTLFTYMFLHEQFLHILFNMLWLFWFGRIFLEYLDPKRLLNVYLLGGLAGAFLYIFSFNVFPVFDAGREASVALGASAAVYAIVIAMAAYVPNYTVYVFLIGPVKIKYIAMVVVLFDILSIPSINAGGHIAHLGGGLFGLLFAVKYRQGKDLTRWFGKMMDSIGTFFKPRPRVRVTYKKSESDMEFRKRKADEQKEIDRILDKIAKGGYESLTREEKEILFRMSNKP